MCVHNKRSGEQLSLSSKASAIIVSDWRLVVCRLASLGDSLASGADLLQVKGRWKSACAAGLLQVGSKLGLLGAAKVV